MFKHWCKALSVVLCLGCSTHVYSDVTGLSDYPLGPGDTLSITVFGEEELSVEVRLSDAGTISYPFLGEINTRGMTIGKLSDTIRARLADGYLVDPSVSVTVLEYRQFFIYGQVKQPGAYPYQPGLTLQKAVAVAGGFTERASSSKFFVLSENQADSAPVKIELNSAINPGDTVTIDESFF